MTKTEYAEYTQSEHWQQRRKGALAYARHACEGCGLPRWVARLVYDQDLHVHHRNYQNHGNEQDEDLEVLCRRCHDIETFGRSDYKEIKKAGCSLCYTDHFNIYSDYCDACRVVFSKEGEERLCFRLDGKDENGEAGWWDVLGDGIRARCPAIITLLKNIKA
jgi:hypothetical protein